MMRKFIVPLLIIILLGSVAISCKVSYTFTGTNISPEVKTFTVYTFPNRAKLINPTLSQNFSEALRDKLDRQTTLNEISNNGDIEFEGKITGYETRPMAVEKDDQSSQTRLTITVKVKYTNHKTPDDSFEKSFSAYDDFESSQSFSSVEDELTEEIIEQLIEDIFNATIANW